jgi:hypothetical protein
MPGFLMAISPLPQLLMFTTAVLSPLPFLLDTLPQQYIDGFLSFKLSEVSRHLYQEMDLLTVFVTI